MVLSQVSSYPSWVICNVVDSVRDTLEDNMSWASEMSENGRSRGGCIYIYIFELSIWIYPATSSFDIGWDSPSLRGPLGRRRCVWSRFPWLFSGLCDISPTSSVSWGIFLQNIMAIFMGHTSNTISWGYGCAMVACIDIYTSTYNWNCTLHFLQTLGLDADGPKPLDPQVKRPYWLQSPAPAARYFN